MLEFLRLREEHLETVLNWRTKPDITRYMFTDIDRDLESQLAWYKRVDKDDTCAYWLVVYQSRSIGVIYLTDISHRHHRSSWGYYIGEPEGNGLGGIILPYLYNYVFYRLGFKKLIAEVLEGNERVAKLHLLHGYRYVGRFQKHIFKNGHYYDMYVYELLAETWHAFKQRYKKYIANFQE